MLYEYGKRTRDFFRAFLLWLSPVFYIFWGGGGGGGRLYMITLIERIFDTTIVTSTDEEWLLKSGYQNLRLRKCFQCHLYFKNVSISMARLSRKTYL